MAKRGRKLTEERKGYFYEKEEQAFVDYINATDQNERTKIFNDKLAPAFTKMIESIIRRYNLYPPNETFKDTFDDTISFMLTRMEKFDSKRGHKAYSYCGTICKNYLIYKINQSNKNQNRNSSYDEASAELSDDIKFSYTIDDHQSFLTDLINETIDRIQEMLEPDKIHNLTANEQKVGQALLNFLLNWEDIFVRMGSNKLNKSAILYFLKQTTMLTTKEIRDAMRKYKLAYFSAKENMLD